MFENEEKQEVQQIQKTETEKMVNLIGFEGDFSKVPIVTFVGESKAAKTTLVAMLISIMFRLGMMIFTGKNGSTTSGPTDVLIDPTSRDGSVCISLKSEDEIRDFLIMNFKDSLLKGLKSILSSAPSDEKKEASFIDKITRDRIVDEDAKFRVSKLLQGESAQHYFDLMKELIVFLKKQVDPSFKERYFEVKKESDKDANIMLSILVDQVLTKVDNQVVPDDCSDLENSNTPEIIPEMVKLIIEEGNNCLNQWGFKSFNDIDVSEENILTGSEKKYWAKDKLSGDEFEESMRRLTNSKDHSDQSIACVVNRTTIILPGKGLKVNDIVQPNDISGEVPYIISDVIGISNDGLEDVNVLARKAMLENIKYDVVVYVGKITTIPAVHASYLKSIFQTIRPAKLVSAITFCDKDDIFDTDEDIVDSDIYNMIHRQKKNMLDTIHGLGFVDVPVIMPDEADVVCLANTVPKRLGDAAERIFKSEYPYDLLRTAFGNGYSKIRRRIFVDGIVRNTRFMKPSSPVEVTIGDTIAKLADTINVELNDLKARANKIHHWTVDAVLWHMCHGNEHMSSAYTWDNVYIQVYTNIRDVLLRSYGDIKFEGVYNFSNNDDVERIKREFTANLLTELRLVSVNLVLKNPGQTNEKSESYNKIHRLAVKPKYNKWLIFEDLRIVLLKAVSQQEYLITILNNAFDNACRSTFERIMI